jgi:hypothetical protein
MTGIALADPGAYLSMPTEQVAKELDNLAEWGIFCR